VLNLALLVAALVVIATGAVVDQLDLNDVALHRWAGYATAGLLALHVGLRWRGLLPPGRSAWSGRPAPPPAPPDEPKPGAVPEPGSEPHEPAGGSQPLRPAPVHPTRRAALAALGAGTAGAVVGWSARSLLAPDPYDGGDVGAFYHQQSSLGLRGLVSDLADWGREPPRDARVGDGVPLPLPPWQPGPQLSVAQALAQRRSLREYADRPLTARELAWVVHAATGITSAQGLRTAPSAGALYPIDTYVAVDRVDGVDPGLYHVDVRALALEPMTRGSVAGDLMVAGLGQEFLRRAPVVVILTGVFQRTRWKYRQRHYRYVCWEGGHIAQNVHLAAEAAGLGACMVGAFLDGAVNDLLGVDGTREAALGLIPVGPRSPASD
jgi:SagB-type dehydrogenase family enzyme